MDIGVAENDEQRESTYRFLNDEISAQHRSLMDEARSTDTKATVVAGFAAALVSFLLEHRRGVAWWPALAASTAALGMSLSSLWPQHWVGLSLRTVLAELADAPPAVAMAVVADSKVTLFMRNSRRVRAKAVLWARSVLLLAGGVILSVASTISEVPR